MVLNACLFVVIPVHNRIHYTRNCLDCLRNQTVKDFTLIVVDDGSTDGTSEMIKREYPEVVLLRGDGDLWWTKATNLGVKYALDRNAEYVMTLNNDTLPANDFVEKMLTWAHKRPKSLLGAFALDAETKEALYGGERLDWEKVNARMLLDLLSPEERVGLHEVSLFPGRGLLIPVEVFYTIGLFDEKSLPHYAADYDFTHRAIRAGYKVYCNYDARILSYSKASGAVESQQNKSIKNYFKHLFSIKGGGNLKIFFLYAVRNCPPRYLLWYLIRGTAQRLVGYWIH
jgi:GT2 family glycosyltransferase